MSIQDLEQAFLEDVEGEEQRRREARKNAIEAERQRELARQRQIKAVRLMEEQDKTTCEQRRIQQSLKERRDLLKTQQAIADWNKIKQEVTLREGMDFFETYLLIYNIRLKVLEAGTNYKFKSFISEYFGFPWDRLAYTEEELKDLPMYLKNRQDMNLLLSLGFWPYRDATMR